MSEDCRVSAYWLAAVVVGYRSDNERVHGAIVIGGTVLLLVSMSHILTAV